MKEERKQDENRTGCERSGRLLRKVSEALFEPRSCTRVLRAGEKGLICKRNLFEEEKIRYEIPIYQRDYAWTEPQIRQLILDIADYAKDKSNCNYYIGTLIVYERKDDYETIYETIDGQQRLTTLSIILNLLYNKNKELD